MRCRIQHVSTGQVWDHQSAEFIPADEAKPERCLYHNIISAEADIRHYTLKEVATVKWNALIPPTTGKDHL